MSTTDQAISSDFVALAADNKVRIPAFDLALRAPARTDATVAAVADGAALLAVTRVYVRRFARAAAGAAALTCAVALVAWLSNPLGLSPNMAEIGSDLEQYIVYLGPFELVSWSAVAVLVTYVAALRIAERRVRRWLVASPPEPLLRRAHTIRDLAVGLGIAGAAALVITVAMGFFTIGLDSYCVFWRPNDERLLGPSHALIVAALIGAVAVAVAIAVLSRRARIAERIAHPLVTLLGVALGLATLVIGSRLDVGPSMTTFKTGVMPSLPLRIALTITGSLAVLLVIASAALRRDRRERAGATPTTDPQ